jgi:starvation-inducible DNA-binding protein
MEFCIMALPHDTRNDLPSKTREKMCELLSERLADALDLRSQIKQAHWNVKGPSFIALHELFDRVVGEIDEHADEIAERATALGGISLGTVRVAAKRTSLKEYPADLSAGKDHVEAVADAIASFGKLARAAIEASDKAGDKDTADLFTGMSREIDKLLWMVEAHAQAKA